MTDGFLTELDGQVHAALAARLPGQPPLGATGVMPLVRDAAPEATLLQVMASLRRLLAAGYLTLQGGSTNTYRVSE